MGTDDRMAFSREADGGLRVHLSGTWELAQGLPSTDALAAELSSCPGGAGLVLDGAGLVSWDSSLVAWAHAAGALAEARGAVMDPSGLPEAARKLLDLARAVPPRAVPQHEEPDDALTARVGRIALHAWGTAGDALTFLGETVQAVLAALRARARYRRVDLLQTLEASGAAALGIVALINFLIGAVLAFVGAVQLQPFGASIYVANLVAIGVTRELGPLMTGIVMAGRTGASFAAALGTMTVNEEVDALRTMGLRPAEFLVLPRVLATTAMLPALVVYADLLGMLGGAFVGVTLLDLGPVQYLRQTQDALALRHVLVGLAKSVAFGAVVSLTGCYYGLRCGRSAAAVGEATTKAVVMGVVLVVVSDAVFTALLHAMRL